MASPLDPPLSSHFLKHQYPEKKVQETESSGESRISQKRKFVDIDPPLVRMGRTSDPTKVTSSWIIKPIIC